MTEIHSEPGTAGLEAAQRRRAAAAFVLITASLAVGVLIGRLSVSMVPAESPRAEAIAAVKPSDRRSEPPKPLTAANQAPPAQPAAQSPQADAAPAQPPKPESPQPPKLELTKDLSKTDNVAPLSMKVIGAAIGDPSPPSAERPDQSADASAVTPADNKVSVINRAGGDGARDSAKAQGASDRSGSTPEKVAASAERPDGRSAFGMDECERRYSSFRREDGTYQPYGGGPRMRCPHLR